MFRIMATSEISIHAPARGATYLRAPVYHFHSNFNPRSREGSDVSGSTISFPSYRFQSTLPRGERPEPDTACYPDQHNFNPRSREGSDIFYGVPAFRGVLFQSTLPRGERRHIGVNVLFHDLFQSTLPRGERPREIHPHQSEHNFNPRSREGSDIDRNVCRCVYRISIHAPARGATDLGRSTSAGVMDFNPRSREGSDLEAVLQETASPDFNPRSREGSDCSGVKFSRISFISIHAPARGATSSFFIPETGFEFQSTLPRGERQH